jgi:hypothetical protein
MTVPKAQSATISAKNWSITYYCVIKNVVENKIVLCLHILVIFVDLATDTKETNKIL